MKVEYFILRKIICRYCVPLSKLTREVILISSLASAGSLCSIFIYFFVSGLESGNFYFRVTIATSMVNLHSVPPISRNDIVKFCRFLSAFVYNE